VELFGAGAPTRAVVPSAESAIEPVLETMPVVLLVFVRVAVGLRGKPPADAWKA
jgi:hypothetical protein